MMPRSHGRSIFRESKVPPPLVGFHDDACMVDPLVSDVKGTLTVENWHPLPGEWFLFSMVSK